MARKSKNGRKHYKRKPKVEELSAIDYLSPEPQLDQLDQRDYINQDARGAVVSEFAEVLKVFAGAAVQIAQHISTSPEYRNIARTK